MSEVNCHPFIFLPSFGCIEFYKSSGRRLAGCCAFSASVTGFTVSRRTTSSSFIVWLGVSGVLNFSYRLMLCALIVEKDGFSDGIKNVVNAVQRVSHIHRSLN